MTAVQELARFVNEARWERVSAGSREALKKRVLDALGCAYGALAAAPVRAIREHTEDFGGNPISSLIGGGRTSPDRAAFHNGAAVRYLDYNDAFLGRGEACHPSDNLAPVLAAAEYANASGEQLLTALAVAYQVQIRLSQVAPVRARGFDHSTQGTFAAAAGVAKVLGLHPEQTANAIAISGTAFNALRVARTGSPFELDWSKEDLEGVQMTIIKRYNAEGHSQSTLEAVLELRQAGLRGEDVERIDLHVFDVSYEIIGPGAGDKKKVSTKEEADHSLPYLVAAALIDGEMTPAQYADERVNRTDVQALLQRVEVHQDPRFTAAFPEHQGVGVEVLLRNGGSLSLDRPDYAGPTTWPELEGKFLALGGPPALVETVKNLDEINVATLAEQL